jgi:uncharacterized membrane protein YfcA
MLIMAFVSYITALISAATGMGGGVIFLIGLNLFLPLEKVIPIHGLIQLKNNAVRVFVLRKYLIKNISAYFTIGCILGVLCVTFALKSLAIHYLNLKNFQRLKYLTGHLLFWVLLQEHLGFWLVLSILFWLHSF